MRQGFDVLNHVSFPESPDDAADDAPAGDAPSVAADRRRLEQERRACEAGLQRLNADLQSLDGERPRLIDAVEPTPSARLQLLASMSPELRTALHGMLGCAQLLRMRGGLDAAQSEWVDSILAAGRQLLGQVHCAVNIADLEAGPSAWLVDDGDPCLGAAAMPDEVAQSWACDDLGRNSVQVPPLSLRVLVADDDAMNRHIASAFIRAAGLSASLAESGEKAVAAAAVRDFDVILMDVRMPGMDGLQATRRIRALPGARGRVPIIALTAQAFAHNVEACRDAGMTGHLAKPFRYDTLNEAILAAAGGHGTAAAPAGQDNGPLAPVLRLPAARLNDARLGLAPTAGASIASFALASPAGTQGGQGLAWIDIASPWHGSQSGGGAAGGQEMRRAYILDTQFKMKFTSIGARGDRRLVDRARSCAPPGDGGQHEFHWLLYTEPGKVDVPVYSSVCDLWRWSDSTWRSIAVPGAHFSPDEMYEQGWRYCGPCAEKTATVEIV